MTLNIGWLYYDLMNTYGDQGNVQILEQRAKQRQIKVKVIQFTTNSSIEVLKQCDLFMMGGAEDRQQKLVNQDLKGKKRQTLQTKIKSGTPGLFICGAYQFLGQYFITADNKKLTNCLQLLPLYTKNARQGEKRLIGEIVVKLTHLDLLGSPYFQSSLSQYLIGFENHGGRTIIQETANCLGKVLKGFGNNDQDTLEGFVYKNTIGTYLHGPILARNPYLADFLIDKALELKYNQARILKPLDNTLANQNISYLLKQLNVKS